MDNKTVSTTKPTPTTNLAVFVSGRGSNLQALINSCDHGELKTLARVTLVVASKADIHALEIADSYGIDRFIYSRDIPVSTLLAVLEEHEIGFIALAGYLRRIEPEIVRQFGRRILNIHPALLPKFGGKGMYGMRVHQAVIESGETVSGVTVHYVSEEYDAGQILAQETVTVEKNDTAETLADKVLKIEHQLYPTAIADALRRLQS